MTKGLKRIWKPDIELALAIGVGAFLGNVRRAGDGRVRCIHDAYREATIGTVAAGVGGRATDRGVPQRERIT